MVLEEMNSIYNSWSILQQPPHASSGINASYRSLLAATDQGWQVEEPVQMLPSNHSNAWTYYFVLTHPVIPGICRIHIPALPEVKNYIERNRVQVIEGSFY
jgi:hypothetical protein